MKALGLAGGLWWWCGVTASAAATFSIGLRYGLDGWSLAADVSGTGVSTDRLVRTSDDQEVMIFRSGTDSGGTVYFVGASPLYSTLDDYALDWADMDYDLTIGVGSQSGIYRFMLNPATNGWFPVRPLFDSIDEPVPWNATFTWQWEGAADAKIFDYIQWTTNREPAGFEGSLLTWSGETGFDSLNQSLNFLPQPGGATVRIAYGNLTPFLVGSWAKREGDDVLDEPPLFYTVSFDERDVQLVPEPMSAALTAGGLALVLAARRRTARRRGR